MRLPSRAALAMVLSYNPSSGLLFWKRRDISYFAYGDAGKNTRMMNSWNANYAGKPAVNSKCRLGYLHGAVLGTSCRAHRVIWKMEYGTEPRLLDHINHVRDDNRLSNLREVTFKGNCTNISIRVDNTSGFNGVQWKKRLQKWVARINVNGKDVHLGVFAEKDDAVNARIAANVKYGFHKNHGKITEDQVAREMVAGGDV